MALRRMSEKLRFIWIWKKIKLRRELKSVMLGKNEDEKGKESVFR
jgi:hypothetical protein